MTRDPHPGPLPPDRQQPDHPRPDKLLAEGVPDAGLEPLAPPGAETDTGDPDSVTRLLRGLSPPPLPRSLAAAVARDIALSARLEAAPVPAAPRSLAAGLAARIAQEASAAQLPEASGADIDATINVERLLAGLPRPVLPGSLAPALAALIGREARAARPVPAPARNPAPLLLVAALLVGLLLLGLTRAWPNLAAGVAVLHALAGGVTPALVGGLLLVLAGSLTVVLWPRLTSGLPSGLGSGVHPANPRPIGPRLGGLALGLGALLVLPSLWLAPQGERVSVGRDVVVSGVIRGDVLSLGGSIRLQPGARVQGQVAAFLGDVQQRPGARVSGTVSALLGRVEGQGVQQGGTRPAGTQTISTQPLALSALPGLGTASAFRPLLALLGSLGRAAWVTLFLLLLAACTLLLFVSGHARDLAAAQRRAPVYTLSLGVLLLGALGLPALALALSGLLGPALVALSLLVLGLCAGLALSLYDAGRAVLRRAGLGRPDALGALLGLGAFGLLTLVLPAAALVALVGGAWGAGSLLTRRAPGRVSPAATR